MSISFHNQPKLKGYDLAVEVIYMFSLNFLKCRLVTFLPREILWYKNAQEGMKVNIAIESKIRQMNGECRERVVYWILSDLNAFDRIPLASVSFDLFLLVSLPVRAKPHLSKSPLGSTRLPQVLYLKLKCVIGCPTIPW